jgi:predicted transcriptional regulator
MTVQTSVKLPEALRARLDWAAARLERDRSAIIVEALDRYLEELPTEDEVRRQCQAANQADSQDDWEAFSEWPTD